MKRLLLAIVPGDEKWLWRRLALLGSVVELLRCLEIATQKGDASTVAQIIIGLIGVLGIYAGASVTDDHLKRQGEDKS